MTKPLCTPLHELHLSLKAKMVPFSGYLMPIQYSSIMQEHLHTRQKVGLFDVSHMGRIVVSGQNCATKLESVVVADLQSLPIGQQVYSLLLNECGGIVDDLMIFKLAPDVFSMVVNAGRKKHVIDFLNSKLKAQGLDISPRFDEVLIALQGPYACRVLKAILPESQELTFMQGSGVNIHGRQGLITRSGYTGEDGFEISLDSQIAFSFCESLLSDEQVMPVGLGARDSLRLEAGLCLYGADIDEKTSLVEATLKWTVGKARRPDGSRPGGFLGAETVFAQWNEGYQRRRVVLSVESRQPVRAGALLVDQAGHNIGHITSGVFSPSLQKPIAMGYVDRSQAKIGQKITSIVRNKPVPMCIEKAPLVAHQYVR